MKICEIEVKECCGVDPQVETGDAHEDAGQRLCYEVKICCPVCGRSFSAPHKSRFSPSRGLHADPNGYLIAVRGWNALVV